VSSVGRDTAGDNQPLPAAALEPDQPGALWTTPVLRTDRLTTAVYYRKLAVSSLWTLIKLAVFPLAAAGSWPTSSCGPSKD
jgi:hypothetical protein